MFIAASAKLITVTINTRDRFCEKDCFVCFLLTQSRVRFVTDYFRTKCSYRLQFVASLKATPSVFTENVISSNVICSSMTQSKWFWVVGVVGGRNWGSYLICACRWLAIRFLSVMYFGDDTWQVGTGLTGGLTFCMFQGHIWTAFTCRRALLSYPHRLHPLLHLQHRHQPRVKS